MRVFKTIRLLWTFYKGFLLSSLVITGFCLNLFRLYGAGIFAVTFWLKIITLGLTFFFMHTYRRKEYFYYQNLGLSPALLWSCILLFDLALFIFLSVQLNKFI